MVNKKTFCYTAEDGTKKRDYGVYDANRENKDRHDKNLVGCGCGATIQADSMRKHKESRDHTTWEGAKRNEEIHLINEEAKIKWQKHAEELKLKGRLVLEASIAFFCTSKPVPPVRERIALEIKRLNELVAQHGKTECWREWVYGQEQVILFRHTDPTRGPSLHEFQLYKQQQEKAIQQLRLQLGIPVCHDDTKQDDQTNQTREMEKKEENKEEEVNAERIVYDQSLHKLRDCILPSTAESETTEAVNKIDVQRILYDETLHNELRDCVLPSSPSKTLGEVSAMKEAKNKRKAVGIAKKQKKEKVQKVEEKKEKKRKKNDDDYYIRNWLHVPGMAEALRRQ
jgi:hypothetical protein